MSSSDIISLVVTAIVLVPVTIYFATRRRQEPAMRFLVGMLVGRFASDLVEAVTWILGDTRTAHFTANVYSLFETVMIVLLFRAKLNPGLSRPLLVLGGCLLATQLYQIVVDPGPFVFLIFSRMVLCFCVTVLTILYFRKLITDLPAVLIYRIPMLWINIGMFVFFTINFMLFMLKDYVVDMLDSDLRLYWGYHNFLAGLSYVLFSVGLLQVKKDSPAPGFSRARS
jgi:hypothetical protein